MCDNACEFQRVTPRSICRVESDLELASAFVLDGNIVPQGFLQTPVLLVVQKHHITDRLKPRPTRAAVRERECLLWLRSRLCPSEPRGPDGRAWTVRDTLSAPRAFSLGAGESPELSQRQLVS